MFNGKSVRNAFIMGLSLISVYTLGGTYSSNRYGTWLQQTDGSYAYSSTMQQQAESAARAGVVAGLATYVVTKNPHLDICGHPLLTSTLLSTALNVIIGELTLKDRNRLVQIAATAFGVYGGYIIGKKNIINSKKERAYNSVGSFFFTINYCL